MKPIRAIFQYTHGLSPYMVVIGMLSIVNAVLAFAVPYVIKFATDWVVAVTQETASFSWMQLGIYAGLLIAASILGIIAGDVGGYFGDQLAVRTRRQLSSKYYQHLLKLPQSYFDNEITGKIINRLSRAISDITLFLQFFSNNLLQLLLTIGLTVVILSIYSWPLAILFVILIPSNLYLTAKTSGKWQKLEAQKNKHFDIASGRFAEAVGQMRLIKSFGSEKREYKTFNSEIGHIVGLTAQQSRHWHKMNAYRGLVFGVINALILIVLFYEASQGKLTIGELAMLLALTQQVSFPMRNLSYFVDSYQRAVANSKDFLVAMNETPEPEDNTKNQLVIKKGEIIYDNVSFAYDKNSEVLQGISFRVKPGQKLALVGESGGGKTTISNLLMGLYTPSDGIVSIDGQDIFRVSRPSLRQAIATVFQDPSLFSGTIRENISYGKPDATDAEIYAAAKAANAAGFIDKLEDGLDTEIGERGIKLSGGQKQRISIARAILKDAPILILDEATSSLDSRAESEVQGALEKLMKNRTTIIIAHRLSTIAQVDQIVTLKDGKVDEVGSPHELAKTDGIYAQLLSLQLGASETDKKRLQSYDIASV